MIFEKKITDAFRSRFFVRYDNKGLARYFDHNDFDGLEKEEFSFQTKSGNTLRGGFYAYPDANKERLVVFDHGIGAGHYAYMREIEALCKNGFYVFAYDHTGCMKSDGESCNGFSQSLADLDACISALVKEGRYKESDISVVGHSWGAFSTMNICALHPDIACIVAMSGFVSPKRIIGQFFSGLLRPYAKCIFNMEKTANPDYCDYDAAVSLSTFAGRGLIIHSRDDKTVSAKAHFDYLRKVLRNNANIRFWEINGKNHNPNYTENAVRLLGEYVDAVQSGVKNKTLESAEARAEFVKSFDWYAITEQDGEVWSKIADFLNGAECE